MERKSLVGSRELKTRLGLHLERVRRGETLLITDRGVPVAELRPIPGSDDPTMAALGRMAASGLVTRPTKHSIASHPAGRPSSQDVSASAAVSLDRDERG